MSNHGNGMKTAKSFSLFPSATFAFDDQFVSIFWHWGLIVHHLRWPLLFCPILLTGFLGFGFIWLDEQVVRE